MLKKLENSCIEMFNAVASNWKSANTDEMSFKFIDKKRSTSGMMETDVEYFWQRTNVDDLSRITFIYEEKYYEEITYSKDFGFESFWSGMGGFVGIFLGYSMMQFPDLFGNIAF